MGEDPHTITGTQARTCVVDAVELSSDLGRRQELSPLVQQIKGEHAATLEHHDVLATRPSSSLRPLRSRNCTFVSVQEQPSNYIRDLYN
ncbi:hypothetical protein MTO96_050294 [Rhipicephalus appendiculatus]